MADATDFAAFMGEVADLLLGKPNAARSTKTELRYGNKGSLSIDRARGVYQDFERGDSGGVLALIGRETGLSNGEAVEWLRSKGFPVADVASYRPGQPAAADSPFRLVATWDYVDAGGELIFQVQRLENAVGVKNYRQRRKATKGDPDDKVRSGWIYSVKGVEQVPYRLPDLVEAIASERLVFFVEGEKCADALWAIGAPSTTSAMGAGKWWDELDAHFAGADVVVLPDNDPPAKKPDGTPRLHPDGRPVLPGQDHAAAVAKRLLAVARSVRVLDLPGLPPKGDVVDWLAMGGTVDKLYDLVDTAARAPAEAAAVTRFEMVWFADAERDLEPPSWLIDDVLVAGEMSLVYGASQSGKSFLATHLAMAVARGVDVFGKKVIPGGVIYVAAEGKKGFRYRLQAYRVENAIAERSPIPFVLVPAAVDMFSEEGDFPAFLSDLRIVADRMRALGTHVALVVIDTHAAVSPGLKENASEDVGRMMKHYRQIQEAAGGAHAMIVHHMNAAGDRVRGWSGFYAGVENAVEVVNDGGVRTARIAKLKDGAGDETIMFELAVRDVAVREDGKQLTSCVVVALSKQDAAVTRRRATTKAKLTDNEKAGLLALREVILARGEPAPGSLGLPQGVKVVQQDAWRAEILKRVWIETRPAASTFRSACQRIQVGLIAKNVIAASQPWVWLVRDVAPDQDDSNVVQFKRR